MREIVADPWSVDLLIVISRRCSIVGVEHALLNLGTSPLLPVGHSERPLHLGRWLTRSCASKGCGVLILASQCRDMIL